MSWETWVSDFLNRVSEIIDNVGDIANVTERLRETLGGSLQSMRRTITEIVDGINTLPATFNDILNDVLNNTVQSLMNAMTETGNVLTETIRKSIESSLGTLPKMLFTILDPDKYASSPNIMLGLSPEILKILLWMLENELSEVDFDVIKGVKNALIDKKRTPEGWMTFGEALIVLVIVVAVFFVLSFLASIEIQIFGNKFSVSSFVNALTEIFGEPLGEAFSEVIDYFIVNPIANIMRFRYGGDVLDDDEIKDVSSSGLFDPNTLAYLGVSTGMMNSGAVAEIVTGLLYNAEAQIRYEMSNLNNTFFEGTEAMMRKFRRALEEADTRILEVARVSRDVIERALILIRAEARKLLDDIEQYKTIKIEYEVIKDDPNVSDQHKLELETLMEKLYESIQWKTLRILHYRDKLLNIAKSEAERISSFVEMAWRMRERIALTYINMLNEKANAHIQTIDSVVSSLTKSIKDTIDAVYRFREQEDEIERWTVEYGDGNS